MLEAGSTSICGSVDSPSHYQQVGGLLKDDVQPWIDPGLYGEFDGLGDTMLSEDCNYTLVGDYPGVPRTLLSTKCIWEHDTCCCSLTRSCLDVNCSVLSAVFHASQVIVTLIRST